MTLWGTPDISVASSTASFFYTFLLKTNLNWWLRFIFSLNHIDKLVICDNAKGNKILFLLSLKCLLNNHVEISNRESNMISKPEAAV